MVTNKNLNMLNAKYYQGLSNLSHLRIKRTQCYPEGTGFWPDYLRNYTSSVKIISQTQLELQ